ncbi:unnamed protein product [Scytosiphon promiscuus]
MEDTKKHRYLPKQYRDCCSRAKKCLECARDDARAINQALCVSSTSEYSSGWKHTSRKIKTRLSRIPGTTSHVCTQVVTTRPPSSCGIFPFRANSATGQRSYQIPGGSPHVSPLQGPMQPLQYGTPPQLGLTPPFLAQGIAGVAPMPPPLTLGQSYNPTSLPGRKWEELYDSWGNKYWVNKVTRQSTNVDPYF